MLENLYTIEHGSDGELIKLKSNLASWIDLHNTQQETISILKNELAQLKLKIIAQSTEIQELQSKGTAFAGKACPQIVSSFI